MTGSVALNYWILSHIQLLILFYKIQYWLSHSRDLIEALRKRKRINDPIMIFFEDGNVHKQILQLFGF